MTTLLDSDPRAADTYGNLADHLIAPLADGARDTAAPIDASGLAKVGWRARFPVVLVELLDDLADESLRVTLVIDPGPAAETALVEFAPHSERGSTLHAFGFKADPADPHVDAFDIQLSAERIAGDGAASPIAAAEIASRFRVRIAEGLLGRLVYLVSAEKMRLRQLGRQLRAARELEQAREDALDRHGRDLRVPRFAETIAYDKDSASIVTSTRREPDDEYRTRLALYRPRLLSTRRRVLELLNGTDPEDEDRRADLPALLSRLGFTGRFDLVEADNAFAVGLHLIAVGGEQRRDNFISWVRETHLVWPRDDAAANAVHAARPLGTRPALEIDELRVGLRAGYEFPADAAVAPELAAALVRVARCRAALGDASKWTVHRAQSSDQGSRFELGLGVELEAPPAATLDAMKSDHEDANRGAADPEVEALLAAMTPVSSSDDADGAWLLEPCGLQTVHRITGARLYVSHFPTYGLVIEGTSAANTADPVKLTAMYHAPGDPGKHTILVEAMAGASAALAAAGGAGWTSVADAEAATLWATATAFDDTASEIVEGAGIAPADDPGTIGTRLGAVAPELHETVLLDQTLSAAILAGQPSAATDLGDVVAALESGGIVSILPLAVDMSGAARVALVLGVTGLPGVGVNRSERRAYGFRWYVVPIDHAAGDDAPETSLGTVGTTSTFSADTAGLYAILVLGYARRGATDPYEFRMELPVGALLDLRQYEYLMNLLAHTYPIGVEVNTWSIRQTHVDLDGDGAADRLTSQISRTYRRFRHARSRQGVPVGEHNE